MLLFRMPGSPVAGGAFSLRQALRKLRKDVSASTPFIGAEENNFSHFFIGRRSPFCLTPIQPVPLRSIRCPNPLQPLSESNSLAVPEQIIVCCVSLHTRASSRGVESRSER